MGEVTGARCHFSRYPLSLTHAFSIIILAIISNQFLRDQWSLIVDRIVKNLSRVWLIPEFQILQIGKFFKIQDLKLEHRLVLCCLGCYLTYTMYTILYIHIHFSYIYQLKIIFINQRKRQRLRLSYLRYHEKLLYNNAVLASKCWYKP